MTQYALNTTQMRKLCPSSLAAGLLLPSHGVGALLAAAPRALQADPHRRAGAGADGRGHSRLGGRGRREGRSHRRR